MDKNIKDIIERLKKDAVETEVKDGKIVLDKNNSSDREWYDEDSDFYEDKP